MSRLREFIVLSGLSGAGKTTGVHALEDEGFYCVDNLPIQLLDPFLDLCERGEGIEKVALVCDIREREFLQETESILTKLRSSSYPLEILFLEASDPCLLRRYQETRRRHPAMVSGETIRDAILRERELLAPLKQLADSVIDTSSLNVHQLRHAIKTRYGSKKGERITICLMSFGVKYGLPSESDTIFDVRFLPNPYFIDELRDKTGKQTEVSHYVLQEAEEFLDRVYGLLAYLLPRYEKEGKANVTIAVGCTGGKHRSVAIVEELKNRLVKANKKPIVVHRDVEKG